MSQDKALARAAELDAEVASLDQELAKTTAERTRLDGEIVDLRNRIEDGDVDGVAPDAIPERRRLAEYYDAVKVGLAKRRDRAKVQSRLAKLAALRAEIENGTGANSAELAKLAQTAMDAMTALAAASHEHTQQLHAWGQRLGEYGVPQHNTPAPEPSPDHAGLGSYRDGDHVGIAAGRHRFRRLNTEHLLQTITRGAQAAGEGRKYQMEPGALTKLTQVHKVVPELNSNERYFVGVGGGIHAFGPDGPNDVEARGLVREIDQNDAMASWWGRKIDTYKEMTRS